eukprot:1555532-Karenia_brevis.AAC.1
MGYESAWHQQHNGISQGCPLSPFLFIIVMTILMSDARRLAHSRGAVFPDANQISEILYADDTMLIGTSQSALQIYMESVAEIGATYGLKFNWS